jgi:hypothetical protein
MNRPSYYIASKTKHAEFWRANRNGGDRITSTWIDEAEEGQTADYAELASRCLREIQEADYLILYCEEGELLKGALLEAGMALALGKRVRCVGDCDSISRVFKKHPLWSSHPSILDATGSARQEAA